MALTKVEAGTLTDREAEGETWPKGCPRPEGDDMVQVLMSEEMARRFEERCLRDNTVGYTHLAGPLLFREDDLPTYIIGVGAQP